MYARDLRMIVYTWVRTAVAIVVGVDERRIIQSCFELVDADCSVMMVGGILRSVEVSGPAVAAIVETEFQSC